MKEGDPPKLHNLARSERQRDAVEVENPQPRVGVSIQEIMTPWKRRGELPDVKTYRVDVPVRSDAVNLGYFHTDQQGSAFVWKGKIDFANLEQIALPELSDKISAGQHRLNLEAKRTRAATVASFILTNNELVEFDLKDQEQYIRYRKTLANPHNISFARYDVTDRSEDAALSYSFTAANEDEAEIGVRIPHGQEWTEQVVSWIVATHADDPPTFVSSDVLKSAAEKLTSIAHIAQPDEVPDRFG